MTQPLGSADQASEAYRRGWSAGLALGALALAFVAFVNLLSLEKSALAIILALIAIRGAGPGQTRTRGRTAIVVALCHWVVAVILFVLFHQELSRLAALLRTLG